ncbi:MAG: hypothetical protein GY849_02095 [Deltaproteobacteria bacterium]|nr:hypothetical protein [Deltaproteobacteria bacterium]
MKLKPLKPEYENIVSRYIKRFEKKHGLCFDWWIAEKVGNTAIFGDYDFSFDEIRFDIDTKQPFHKILNYYDYRVEQGNDTITFQGYCEFLKTFNLSEN